jgi:hypothetical protein
MLRVSLDIDTSGIVIRIGPLMLKHLARSEANPISAHDLPLQVLTEFNSVLM